MAEAELNISPEARRILEIIRDGESFLLSGGAGSGKTYSLVETIRAVIAGEPSTPIACITYTNAAVREIEDRVKHHHLHVSTIHDFLWDNIKSYQADLKNTLIDLIADEGDEFKNFKLPEGIEPSAELFSGLERGIQYKEYVKIKEGIISHDELLILASKMYEAHPKLCEITKDRYPYIFVDEYQDTSPHVIRIMLEHFKSSTKKCILGFFGDAMQSIYPDTVGDIGSYIGTGLGEVKEVKKEQNRRNPRLVYELANKLRNDGLVQEHSNDSYAPNMVNGRVKDGCIQFVYSSSDQLGRVRDYLNWNGDIKELNLTHNLIAGKAGFRAFMDVYSGDKVLGYVNRIKKHIKNNGIDDDFSDKTFGDVVQQLSSGKTGRELTSVSPTPGMRDYIDENKDAYDLALAMPYQEISSLYVDKEQLLDDKKDDAADSSRPRSKRDDLIKHLFRIQENIYYYQAGMLSEFLRATDYRILSIKDKEELKLAIESLVVVGDKTVAQIIQEADTSGICKIDDRLERFKENNRYLYLRVEELRFSQFQNLYKYLEGRMPFSTQHKTKGREYTNVLVILDNGRWNDYNFKSLFEEQGTPSVLERTRKIFYVCCTRAKENLAVFYHNPPAAVISKAKVLFGENNVVNLDDRE